MKRNFVKRVIESVINEDVNKACGRLAYFLDTDALEALCSDKLAINIVKFPEITTMHQFDDFAKNCNKNLTTNAKKALDCETEEVNNLRNVDLVLQIKNENVYIRYDYKWIEEEKEKTDYDSITISVEEAEKAGFEFEYI